MVTSPSRGGDTVWTNQYLAYETLSPAMRDLLSGLSAVHTASPMGHPEIAASHPVVRIHPETGRRSLYVNRGFTSHFVELGRERATSCSPSSLHGLNNNGSSAVTGGVMARSGSGTTAAPSITESTTTRNEEFSIVSPCSATTPRAANPDGSRSSKNSRTGRQRSHRTHEPIPSEHADGFPCGGLACPVNQLRISPTDAVWTDFPDVVDGKEGVPARSAASDRNETDGENI